MPNYLYLLQILIMCDKKNVNPISNVLRYCRDRDGPGETIREQNPDAIRSGVSFDGDTEQTVDNGALSGDGRLRVAEQHAGHASAASPPDARHASGTFQRIFRTPVPDRLSQRCRSSSARFHGQVQELPVRHDGGDTAIRRHTETNIAERRKEPRGYEGTRTSSHTRQNGSRQNRQRSLLRYQSPAIGLLRGSAANDLLSKVRWNRLVRQTLRWSMHQRDEVSGHMSPAADVHLFHFYLSFPLTELSVILFIFLHSFYLIFIFYPFILVLVVVAAVAAIYLPHLQCSFYLVSLQ